MAGVLPEGLIGMAGHVCFRLIYLSPNPPEEKMPSTTESSQPGTAERLSAVQDNIAIAAVAGGRDVEDITLVAVSKTQPVEAIIQAIEAGQVDFGENRVQEAQEKWPALKEQYPHVRLHLLGNLQSNKLRDALALFDVFHTLDRPKLAAGLARLRDTDGLAMPQCFVQVNTGEEPQKAGVGPHDVDPFVARCRDEFGLDVAGLMCIPPHDEDAALHFSLLGKLARRNGVTGLSMGMSGDYEMAVEMGATHVRVGTAIFGPRTF
jgi:pyridoxal phosphate enzyme (YggS family)